MLLHIYKLYIYIYMDSVGFRFIHSPKAPLDRNVTHCQTLLRHSCNDARVCQEDATGDWHVAFCKMIRKMVPSGLQLTTSGTKMPKEILLTASRRAFHCACFNLILLQDIFTIVMFFGMWHFFELFWHGGAMRAQICSCYGSNRSGV